MKKIFKSYKKYIINIARNKYPDIRKRKYPLEYYLNNFVYMLNDLVKWSALKLVHKSRSDYHWKSIYNEFKKWSNDSVFKEAYILFLKNEYFKISSVRRDKKINLFIDATKIYNKYGSDKIGINFENKKKNVTVLTGICDDNKIPLAFEFMDTNLSKTKSGRNKIKHDLNGVQPTLNNIPVIFKKYINIKLIGDKGYVTPKKFNMGNRKIGIIYPKRKNQKKKNTIIEKRVLKKRHKIENVFASIKKYSRINVRKDRKIIHYMSFTYIGLFDYLFKII
jgi:transposase